MFRPALSVVRALPEGKAVNNVIRTLTECANRVADSLSELGYDHAGPLYHRILGSAKSDGAFYTNNLSAIMLAQLALTEDLVDWSDAGAVANLRIMDPACGTGTLLMASLQTMKARIDGYREMSDKERNALHKHVVEDVLCGLDINQHGIQLAACNMTLGAPTVDYERMNLVTMPHGPQSVGAPKAGSLEILTTVNNDRDLHAMTAPQRSLQTLNGAQVNESSEIRFPLRDLDVVIMNPPFTANENRSTKYGADGRKAMQRHELDIQRHVEHKDTTITGVITTNSIRSFFTPLADTLLTKTGGTLAEVIPTTACTGTSGVAERKLLAQRFHVETVITSHDPKRPNFSENTSIHESLLICRRRNDRNEGQPTRFIALCAMPTTFDEAMEAIEAIRKLDTGKWFSLYEQPESRVTQGDWRPCQFLDPELVEAAMLIEQWEGVVPLEHRYHLGPAGRRIRDAFSQIDRDDDNSYRVFWGRSKDLRTTMEATPEQSVIEKKKKLATRYREQAGHVLLAAKFDTLSGKLTAIFSDTPAVGSMWIPIQSHTTPLDEAKALCAWHNSTLGVLAVLMRRSTKLTNPSFSQAELATLPVPDFRRASTKPLVDAYETTKSTPTKAWRSAADDAMRDCLDAAAAQTTGIDLPTIREWRARLSREPTVRGEIASEHLPGVADKA